MWGKNWPTPRPHVSGYFWIRNIFFPDTTTVNTHPPNSTAYQDIFKSAYQSRKNKSATNPATCERLNPDIFESDDVAKSFPVSHRTINQYGGTICRPRANKANVPLYRAFYGACYRREARGNAVNPDTIGCVWTRKFDLNTLHVDGEFFKSGKKKLRIQTYPDTCGRSLSVIDKSKGFLAITAISQKLCYPQTNLFRLYP